MNIFTTPRHWALAVMTFVCLFAAQSARGQCSDFIAAPPTGTVTIILPLDANGDAQITNAVLNANGFQKNGACDYWLSTSAAGPYTNTPINFTCNPPPNITFGGVGNYNLYVRTGGTVGSGGIGTLGGPGATIIAITVNVVDNIFPTISANAGPFARNADATPAGSCRYTIVAGDAPSFNPIAYNDNCLSYTVEYSIDGTAYAAGTSVVGLTLNGAGAHTIQWRIRDASNNTTTAPAFTVTVTDITPPTITCPANQNVGTDAGVCSYAYVGAAATATDNCSVTAITNNYNGLSTLTGAVFPAGVAGAPLTTNVTWTASDGSSTMNCVQMITVTDDESPTVTCPFTGAVTRNISAAPGCTYSTLAGEFNATGSDNCSLDPLGYVIQDNTAFPVYTGMNTIPAGTTLTTAGSPYTITWTASDAEGNPDATCSFTVNVTDATVPVVSFFPFDSSGVIIYPTTVGGTTSSYTTNANNCFSSVTIEQPNNLVIDLGIPYVGPNFLAPDCSGPVTITRLPNAVIDGFVPPFAPGDPTNRMLTANFPTGTTTITYVVSDASVPANTSVITITVTVTENTPPVAKCKNALLQLDANGLATLAPASIDNGSSDNCSGITLSASKTAFNCTNVGANLVTLTVTDNSSLTATCVSTVTVVDNLLPTLTCPLSAVVPMTAACTGTPSNIAMASGNATDPGFYNDNCGVVKVEYKIDGGAFVLGSNAAAAGALSGGLHTINYRVSDAANNSSVCNFTVNVKDLTGPSLTCPTPTVTLGSGCFATATWPTPVVTDACTPMPAPTLVSTHTSGSLFSYGMTTVVYTATDGAGNISTCSFVVNVVDTQAPVLVCKPNITVSLNSNTAAQPTQVTVNATDIITSVTDNSCFYTVSPTNQTYSCANLGTNTYVITVKDNAMPVANQTTCTTTVTVQDVTPPVATCPAGPITLFLTGNPGTAILTATAVGSGTDNCGVTSLLIDRPLDAFGFASNITFSCVDAQTTANPTFSQVVTLQVADTDPASPNATCTRTVIIQDVTAPVLTIPANITLTNYCDLANNPAPAITGTATATDICSGTLTPTFTDVSVGSPVCPDKKIIDRTWKATDASGNTTTLVQRITLRDITPPTISNPPVIPVLNYLPADANCVKIYALPTSVWATDDCGTVTYSYSIDYPPFGSPDVSGSITGSSTPLTFRIGQNQFTLTAADACGLTSSTTLTVTVLDKTKPTINEPFAEALGNTDNVCGQTFTITNANNNCGNTFSWFRPYVNGAGPLDDDFTDCSTITSVTESFITPPGQGSISVAAFNYNSAANAHPTAFFPVGSTVITYSATDAAGNTAVCSFTVKVNDIQPPVPTCPPNQILSTICPGDPFPDYRNLVSVQDNCNAIVQKKQSPAPGVLLSTIFGANPQDGQSTTVTITARDSFPLNLSATCTFTVTLADGSAPVPVVTGQLPTKESFCGSVTVNAPEATDNAPGCNPNPTIIYGTPSTPVGMLIPGSNPPQYNFIYTPAFGNPSNYVVTWIYNDGNGNQSSQLQNIIVWKDDFPPVAKCKDITVDLSTSLNGTANVSITPAMVDNGSNDNGPMGCGTPITLVSAVPNGFGCANIGANTVVLTVADAANPANTTTCTSIVTVRDITTPVLNSVPVNITLESCHDVIPAAAVVTSSDNCTAPVVYTETSTQTASGCGKYTYNLARTWTATDGDGNVAQSTQVISIKDTKPPFFASSLTNLSVTTEGNDISCDGHVVLDVTSSVKDSCSLASEITITQSYTGAGRTVDASCLTAACASGDYAVGAHTLTFTATDICGNVSVKTINITVTDATIPTAVCINGVSAALQSGGSVTVGTLQFNNNSFDNCPGVLDLKIQRLDPLLVPSPTITYSCADADGVTKHPVKLYVKDASGNESTCQTYIVIQDNAAPSFTFCPTDKTVDCQVSLDPALPANGTAIATDNCPLNVTVTYSDTVSFGNTPLSCQLLTRIWLAKDLAGNTASCVQHFTIQDTKPPIFTTLPADATISCSDPLVTPPVLTATDNCSAPADIDITYAEVRTDTAVGACGQYSYTVQRTWTATDECGNTKQHTQSIVVSDNVAPVFSGLQDTLVVLSSNHPPTTNCTVPVALNVSQSITDCSPTSAMFITNDSPYATSGVDASGIYPVGLTMVIFTATDLCGNIGKDSVIVKVVDNSIPTVICNNSVVIALGTNGSASLQPNDINLGSTDNCTITNVSLSPTSFDCSNIGSNNVVLTVTDNNGNTNSCTVAVQVTVGPNVGFSLTTTATPESHFGFADGSAQATVTGGSGMFSYSWSPNGANTANINNLAAGTYIVTVIDQGTNCMQTDTVIVAAGKKITVIVGDASGSAGQIVQVPVTVNNFYQVNGFSFAVFALDSTVGKIIGTNTLNALLPGFTATINNNKVNALWVSSNAVTLPDGALLFNIDVQLKANAPLNAESPVNIVPPFQFLQSIGGTPTQVMADMQDGSVTITTVVNTVKIGGDIQTWKVPVKPVPNVNVSLTGDVNLTQVTGVPGTYLFTVPTGSTTVVTPTKATAGNANVTAADLLLIQNHIFGNVLSSPYQWIAANVNNSGGANPITLADYLLIQRVVLGTDQHIQGSVDWKFVPKTYVFPTPNPLSVPFPTTISHAPANMDFLDDDFVAVRMGDVNGNIIPMLTNNESEDRSSETFRFRLDDRTFRAGEVITVPFKASDFTSRQAYQMTINFDPTVFALENIGQGALQLTDDNFGTTHLSDGSLSTVWVSREPVTLRDEEVLFTLTFRTLRAGQSLRAVLHPGSDVTNAEAYDQDGKTMKIDFDFAQSVNNQVDSDFALYQNQPNPFQGQTTIGFRLPSTSRATLRVFNASGRLVKTVVGDFEKGYNEVNFRPDELGAAGIYWYELETPTHSDRKKMILMQ